MLNIQFISVIQKDLEAVYLQGICESRTRGHSVYNANVEVEEERKSENEEFNPFEDEESSSSSSDFGEKAIIISPKVKDEGKEGKHTL